MKHYIYIILAVLFLGIKANAQNVEDATQIVNDIIESISETEESDVNDKSELFDELINLYENSININNATQKELEKLVFLSDIQIYNILSFISSYGKISSQYQLQGIKGLTQKQILNLLHFITIEPVENKYKTQNYLKGQVILRDQINLKKSAGYLKSYEDGGFEGDRHHLYSKVQLQYGKKYYMGCVLDKDPGEVILPPDYYAGYFMYKGDKFVKKVIVGDFSANFGQGLSLWTGTSMRKTSEPLNIKKRGDKLKKYSSANEMNFFRGVASSFSYKNIDLSIFASHKNVDASIDIDTITNTRDLLSLPQNGYHRTKKEQEKAHSLTQSTFGGELNYRYKNLSLSLGGYYNKYHADTISSKYMYNMFIQPQKEFKNYWIGYNYGFSKFILYGEYALSKGKYPGFVSGILFKPVSSVNVALLYRNFHKKYYSVWSSAFTENSKPAGEEGYYLGLDLVPVRNLRINGYIDIFKDKWLRYYIDKPSNGYDILGQVSYNFRNGFTAYLRYKEKEKFHNQTVEDSPDFNVVTTNSKKLRLHTKYRINSNWYVDMRLEHAFYYEENEGYSDGNMLYSGLGYSTPNEKLSFKVRYGFFDTDNYDTRIYTYENDLLYNFATPAFQGKGTRAYFLVKWKIIDRLNFWFKIEQTAYDDRKSISSGLSEVEGNKQTMLKGQLQFKF